MPELESLPRLMHQYADTLIDEHTVAPQEYKRLVRNRIVIVSCIRDVPGGERIINAILQELRPEVGERLTTAELQGRIRGLAAILEL